MNGFLDQNFSFDEIKVVPKANLLVRSSKEKRIEPKVMSLLVFLASRQNEVVTRNEILEELWPNIVVGNEVISQLIYSLRNNLGDDAKKPRYIETIPKKGYRFISKIETQEKEHCDDTKPIPLEKTHESHELKKRLLPAFLILIIVSIVWFVNDSLSKKQSSPITVKGILPVTQKTGVEESFSFHKNHNKMVYIGRNKGSVDLHIKTLNSNLSQQLTDDEWFESSPLWLDEQTLIYIRSKFNQHQIVIHPLKSNAKVVYETDKTIIDLTINSTRLSDVTFIEYDKYQHNRLFELKSLNLTTLESTYLHDSITKLPSEVSQHIYSLDGKKLYLVDEDTKQKRIMALDLKTNQYSTLTNKFAQIYYISVLDSENLLVTGKLSANKGVWRLNTVNNSISRILLSSTREKITRAHYHNSQIYYETYKSSINQFVANIGQKSLDLLPGLNSDANEFFGIYSKDKKTIYFNSDRTGFYEIWSYDLIAKKTRQITNLQANFIYRPILSNGEEYLSVVYEKSDKALAVISLNTGGIINKTKIPHMKYPLAWSADDKSIYISEHKKHVTIFQYDATSLEPQLIQQKAGLFAQEHSTNKSLSLIDYTWGGLIHKDLTNGGISRGNNTIRNLEYLAPGELKMTNNSIIAVYKKGATRELYQYSLEASEQEIPAKLLMTLPNNARVTDFSIDGTRALFHKSSEPEGDIMTIILK